MRTFPCEKCDSLAMSLTFREPWNAHVERILCEASATSKSEKLSRVLDERLVVLCDQGHSHQVKWWVDRSTMRIRHNMIEANASGFTVRLWYIPDETPTSTPPANFFADDQNCLAILPDMSKLFWYLESKYFLAKYKGSSPHVPESFPLLWDVSEEELHTRFDELITPDTPFVLKRDGGSSGSAVFFVETAQELVRIISEEQSLEYALPFLEDRPIANFSLQRFISHPMSLEIGKPDGTLDRHKFHIRVYTLSIAETTYMYSEFEVRIAPKPIVSGSFEDLEQHLTNGCGYNGPGRRFLASSFPELAFLQQAVPEFLSSLVDPQKEPEAAECLPETLRSQGWCDLSPFAEIADRIAPCAFVGHDVFVNHDKTLLLLESNHSPSAPPPDLQDPPFLAHIDRLLQDLLCVLVTNDVKDTAFVCLP